MQTAVIKDNQLPKSSESALNWSAMKLQSRHARAERAAPLLLKASHSTALSTFSVANTRIKAPWESPHHIKAALVSTLMIWTRRRINLKKASYWNQDSMVHMSCHSSLKFKHPRISNRLKMVRRHLTAVLVKSLVRMSLWNQSIAVTYWRNSKVQWLNRILCSRRLKVALTDIFHLKQVRKRRAFMIHWKIMSQRKRQHPLSDNRTLRRTRFARYPM